jgi:carboxyl-terminal processing protease
MVPWSSPHPWRCTDGSSNVESFKSVPRVSFRNAAGHSFNAALQRVDSNTFKRPMPKLEQADPAWPADTRHQYRKPVAVLISGATYSAAEDFMVAFDSMKRGLIVGEPTGGSTGQPLMISLPGGGTARIGTKRDTYPDGRAWVGVGIQPGLKVAPTVADLRKGRDTMLEAALATLRK